MRFLHLFRRQKTRRQRDVIADVMLTSGKKKRLTVRIPLSLYQAVASICKQKGLTINEAVILLFKWTSEQTLEFEIVKRVRRRTQDLAQEGPP